MNNTSRKYFLTGIVIAMVVIFADQYSKWFVMENLLRVEAKSSLGFIEWLTVSQPAELFLSQGSIFKAIVITPFLNFVMVWNKGVSFGMFSGSEVNLAMVFTAISAIAAVLLTVWLFLIKNKYMAISLGLLIGGAIGNVIDRLRFGAVADFIDVYLGSYHWPAFNVADSCIAIGATVMIVITFMDDEGKGNEKAK